MFYQMTRRSKDYKQSLIQRKLEEKTNKKIRRKNKQTAIPFLSWCPVAAGQSWGCQYQWCCPLVPWLSSPLNHGTCGFCQTSQLALSCFPVDIQQRNWWKEFMFGGAGVGGGGNMAYWLTHQTVNPVARVWLLVAAGQRTCSILLSQNLFRFISLPCFFVCTACTKIVVHVIDPKSTFSRHNDQWHGNTQTMHNSSRITSDVCGCSWWK